MLGPALNTTSGHQPPDGTARLRVKRLRIGGLTRLSAGCGWMLCLPGAFIAGILTVWSGRTVWSWLDTLAPWSPWPSGQSVGGIALPTPEVRPREFLQLERVYLLLTPVQQHPILAVLAVTAFLTVAGAALITFATVAGGLLFNLFARLTGGLEVEMGAVSSRVDPDLAADSSEGGDRNLPDPDALTW